MAIPLIPLAGAALQFIPAIGIYALAGLLLDREFGDNDSLPDVSPQIPPFIPPFEGGQCTGGARYRIISSGRVGRTDIGAEINSPWTLDFDGYLGAISEISAFVNNPPNPNDRAAVYRVIHAGGADIDDFVIAGFGANTFVSIDSIQVIRSDGGIDNCGNLPNPNAPIPPSIGGGSLSPISDSPIEVSGGIPVPSFAALLAALRAIADSIGAIGDVLEGVRKIGDAINKIREILDEFLDRENEKDKKDRDKRKISVGAWRRMGVDGGFAVGKFTAQNIEYSPYQLQIEIERFPSTVSRRLGINSPSYAHLEPIGWVFLRSASGGYSEPVPLRFLRNSISLNEDTTGVSFSFRENPQAKADCRIWYSSDPSIS